MKRKRIPICMMMGIIALLVYFECGESEWKDVLLKKIGTSLCEEVCPMNKLKAENVVGEVVLGDRIYFQGRSSKQSAESKLIYMENQGEVKEKIELQSVPEEGIVAPGEGTAVAGENLTQVQTMTGGTAGTAAYVNKLRENKDVNYLWNHFYIIDSTTSVTKELFPVERMLKRNMTLPQKQGIKQVLIYHSHGASESFKNSRKGKEEDSIIGVGNKLTEELEKQGYGVYHDKTKYDLINGKIDRSDAYNASLEGVSKILKENPDIQVVIDLHRDAVGKNKHTYTMVDGKKTAIVMFFNGLSRSKSGEIAYLKNPNLEANLSFSLQLKCHAMELYEGFTKPIYLKGYRYNLHVAERALLIELGNENNTVEEAKNATIPLAKVIADVLKGEAKYD